jgi:hypothetical protein
LSQLHDVATSHDSNPQPTYFSDSAYKIQVKRIVPGLEGSI